MESANDRIDSLILAMAFDSNLIKQHRRIKANEMFSGIENHSDSGFVSAWFQTTTGKEIWKRINLYLLLRFKGFGKIFYIPIKIELQL